MILQQNGSNSRQYQRSLKQIGKIQVFIEQNHEYTPWYTHKQQVFQIVFVFLKNPPDIVVPPEHPLKF
jgi:hypothetical protein